MRLRMSFLNDRTGELWRSFMPRRKEIRNPASGDLYSLQVYAGNQFTEFDPAREFEKWALVEVDELADIPEGMELFLLQEGLYAVFRHKGAAGDTSTFDYIFTTWLPESTYELDNRPHFERLGPGYSNNDPDSEEEIWIPVRPKVQQE